MKKSLVILVLLAQQCFAQGFTESFGNIPALYITGGWISVNKSQPANQNTWNAEPGNFTGTCMGAGWYCTDTVGTGDASVWLFTPPLWLHHGDSLSFYTISFNNTQYPDRLEVRLNTTNADTFVGSGAHAVGYFTHLQLTINPELDKNGYPMTWTKYKTALSEVPAGGVMGRLAFRYAVPHTGGAGTQGSVVAIDEVSLRSVADEGGRGFDISPQTVSRSIKIRAALPIQSLDLLNAQGIKCKRVRGIGAYVYELDLADVPPGMHCLHIQTPGGNFSKRFIKVEE